MAKARFPSDDMKKFMTRLPDDLNNALAKSAHASGCSKNAEIIRRLRESFGPEFALTHGGDSPGIAEDLRAIRSLLEKHLSGEPSHG